MTVIPAMPSFVPEWYVQLAQTATLEQAIRANLRGHGR